MKFRKLRIAWSVVWAFAFAISSALWMRSSRYEDIMVVPLPTHQTISFESYRGKLFYYPQDVHPTRNYWDVEAHSAQKRDAQAAALRASVALPDWFVAASCVALAAIPWLAVKSFSLHTLLIATTLIAIVLGLIVWAAK